MPSQAQIVGPFEQAIKSLYYYLSDNSVDSACSKAATVVYVLGATFYSTGGDPKYLSDLILTGDIPKLTIFIVWLAGTLKSVRSGKAP